MAAGGCGARCSELSGCAWRGAQPGPASHLLRRLRFSGLCAASSPPSATGRRTLLRSLSPLSSLAWRRGAMRAADWPGSESGELRLDWRPAMCRECDVIVVGRTDWSCGTLQSAWCCGVMYSFDETKQRRLYDPSRCCGKCGDHLDNTTHAVTH